METITIWTRDGASHDIPCPANHTLMEAIREAGLDELLALCGGACACATCHVYVDAGPGPEGDLPPIGEDESELLETSSHRTARSRLSCQIRATAALAARRITIAPED